MVHEDGHSDISPLLVNHLSLHPVELSWTSQLSDRDSVVKCWVLLGLMTSEAEDRPEMGKTKCKHCISSPFTPNVCGDQLVDHNYFIISWEVHKNIYI